MTTDAYYPDEMTCCACGQPIGYLDRMRTFVWVDPQGRGCVAHRSCLKRMGEVDLGLDLPPSAA